MPLNLIGWFGGKTFLLKHLLPFPKHKIFVDVFGGGGSVLLNKIPSDIEVFNDINGTLINFWLVIKNYLALFRLVGSCTYDSASIFRHFHENEDIDAIPAPIRWMIMGMKKDGLLQELSLESIMKAYRFFILNKLSFSANNAYYHGVSVDKKTGNFQPWRFFDMVPFGETLARFFHEVEGLEHGDDEKFQEIGDTLELIHDRIKDVMFVNRDYKFLLDTFDRRDALIYLDPPYFGAGGRYTEFSDGCPKWEHDDFVELGEILANLEHAKFVFSIDEIDIYEKYGWHVTPITATKMSSNKKYSATRVRATYREHVLRNYDPSRVRAMSHGRSLLDFMKDDDT